MPPNHNSHWQSVQSITIGASREVKALLHEAIAGDFNDYIASIIKKHKV